MNFSREVKSELMGRRFDSSCCRHAALSAYIRTAAFIESRGGEVGFEFASEGEAAEYFKNIIVSEYGVEPETLKEDKPGKRQKTVYTFVNDKSLGVLVDLGLAEVDERGVAIKLNIDEYAIENECCKTAYIKGAFLGSGSVTLPSADKATGYHLEFVFTNYQTATDFCELLSELYFMPKLAERKGGYIVYFKSRDEITELLGVMGASKAVLKLSAFTVEKDFNNTENRRLNCEMSNMTKQIDASVKQVRAVQKIDETVGLDSLDDKYREVAKARLKNTGMTLSELAAILGISKSCLNHRLRKIVEISEEL